MEVWVQQGNDGSTRALAKAGQRWERGSLGEERRYGTPTLSVAGKGQRMREKGAQGWEGSSLWRMAVQVMSWGCQGPERTSLLSSCAEPWGNGRADPVLGVLENGGMSKQDPQIDTLDTVWQTLSTFPIATGDKAELCPAGEVSEPAPACGLHSLAMLCSGVGVTCSLGPAGGPQVAVTVTGSDSPFPQREQALEQEWEQLLQQEHPRLESSTRDDDDREAVLTPEHR